MSWGDCGTEAEALNDQWDGEGFYDGERPLSARVKALKNYRNPRRGKSKVDNSNRFRCTVTGCNPRLIGQTKASEHTESTDHRIAAWPVRSSEGKSKAQERNRTGYYDKYNVGEKRASIREGFIK